MVVTMMEYQITILHKRIEQGKVLVGVQRVVLNLHPFLHELPTYFETKVSLVDIHLVNNSVDKEGGTTVVGCDQNDASIQKEM
ncbi:hypothetical protein Tco_0274761 [Tanacetum coccineum]